MIVDFQTLRDFDLPAFETARKNWSDIEFAFTTDTFGYQLAVLDPVEGDSWTGTAADNARRAVRSAYHGMIATGRYLDIVSRSLKDAITGIREAKQRCDVALELAQHNGFDVDDTGHVKLTNVPATADWYNPPILTIMRIQKMIYEARFMAYTVDSTVCPILRYADKFGPNDAGTWQQDAVRDQEYAGFFLALLRTQLSELASADPPDPADDDAQAHAFLLPSESDLQLWVELDGGALPYFQLKGWHHAFQLLERWMLGIGGFAVVNPDDMLAAMPAFRATALDRFGTAGDASSTPDGTTSPRATTSKAKTGTTRSTTSGTG